MGFHVSHVWKTTDAGHSWSDFSGSLSSSLPDAPANTILVDNGTVYVGTDVGVFSTSTSNPTWTEVGPTPVPNGPGTGYLPDVPVTALRLFNNGATKLLRAATYGRGVWQFPLATAPDFQIAFTKATQYVFAGQTVDVAGILSAFDGFNDPVTLLCSGTSLPGTCSVASSPLTPAGSSIGFAVTAGGAVGDYAFNVTATGGGLSRSASLNLHVVDLSLGAPSPASVSVGLGSTSSASNMQVNLDGSFPSGAAVTLSCTAPAGLSCNFFPSNTVGASSGPKVTIALTVSASSSAGIGNSVINISASSTDAGSKTVSAPLSCCRHNQPGLFDYAWTAALRHSGA